MTNELDHKFLLIGKSKFHSWAMTKEITPVDNKYKAFSFPLIFVRFKNTPTIITCPTLAMAENFVSEKITIYPNPTNGIINIPSEFGIQKMVIYDLSGKILMERELHSEAVDVQNLSSGMYLMKLFAGDKNYQTKFIKI